MAEKGVLNSDLEKLAIKGLDYIIATKGAAEVATDAVIKLFVPIIDNNVIDGVLSDEIKEPIREAGQLLYDGADNEKVSEKLTEALSAITKGEESDALKEAYKAQFKAFILWIKLGLDLVKKEESEEE